MTPTVGFVCIPVGELVDRAATAGRAVEELDLVVS